jgi:hypothetical protein
MIVVAASEIFACMGRQLGVPRLESGSATFANVFPRFFGSDVTDGRSPTMTLVKLFEKGVF